MTKKTVCKNLAVLLSIGLIWALPIVGGVVGCNLLHAYNGMFVNNNGEQVPHPGTLMGTFLLILALVPLSVILHRWVWSAEFRADWIAKLPYQDPPPAAQPADPTPKDWR